MINQSRSLLVAMALGGFAIAALQIRQVPRDRPDPGSKSKTLRAIVFTEDEDRTPGVFTYHNDWARTGQHLTETVLSPSSVNAKQFGLLRTDFRVDGMVYAQPLYAPNVQVGGTTYNLAIVATEHNTVYAFDADADLHAQNASVPLWQRSLLNPGATPVPTTDIVGDQGVVCGDISPEIGITSTPVIDPATGVLYVVAKSKEADGSYAYTLGALDIRNGLDAPALGGPVRIEAAVRGTGDDAVVEDGVGIVHFAALRLNQRAALALVNGIVYVGFASYCDQIPYHGWLLGYDTRNLLKQVVAWNPSPHTIYGGIWSSGGAPAIDTDGSMYLLIANGPFDPVNEQWGNSIVKLPVDRRTIINRQMFGVLDYFGPFNNELLYALDLDLGSSGMTLLPDQPGVHPRIMVGGGKQGIIYVVDRDRLTDEDKHLVQCSDDDLRARALANDAAPVPARTDTCDPVIQAFKNSRGTTSDPTLPSTFRGPGVFSTPAYWNGFVYIGALRDNLKMFEVRDGTLLTDPRSMSANVFSFPGVTASISANGDRDGIVWAVDSGYVSFTPAVLYAFDARDLTHVLYKSSGSADDEGKGIVAPGGADTMDSGVKFSVPTVFNGKVYVATQSRLHVFGLRH